MKFKAFPVARFFLSCAIMLGFAWFVSSIVGEFLDEAFIITVILGLVFFLIANFRGETKDFAKFMKFLSDSLNREE